MAGGGPVVSASDGLKRDSAIQWSHSDVTIDDDGQVTRTVSDGRSITHLEKRERYVTGLSLGHVSMMTTDHGGSGTVSVTTVSTGGYIGSGGGGRFIVDPDSLLQHVVKTGESSSSHVSTESYDGGGPRGIDAEQTVTGTVEYELSWTKPAPPEGEEEWVDDPGPVLSLTAYQTTNRRRELRTDDSQEGQEHWTSALSSEVVINTTESLASNNQVATNVVATSTFVPFPWTGESPSSGTSTNSGTSDFQNPGVSSGFAQTHHGFDDGPWVLYYFDPLEESPGAAPTLTDTFSAGVGGPVSQVRDGQHSRMRYFADQESTPVEDDIPAEKTTPQLPSEDGCNCQCGDDTGSDGDYFDGSGDWVGDIYGDEIDRRGKVRYAEDVSEYDQENPEATPADWDAFFAGGGGLNLRAKLDMRYFPVAGRVLELGPEVMARQQILNEMARQHRITAAVAKVEAEFAAKEAFRQRVKLNTWPEEIPYQHIDFIWGGAQAAGSFAPLVGESLDVATFFDPEATKFDMMMAVGSLGINFFTAGLAPNYGGVRGALDATESALKGASDNVAKVADRAAGAASEAACEARGGTYVLRDVDGNVMRSGRTGNLSQRQAQHGSDPFLRDYRFDPIHYTDNYAQQRGLEQVLHDLYNPPLNYIRPINPKNPNLQEYMDAAKRFLEFQQ